MVDRYSARMNLRGTSYRERMKNRLIDNLNNKVENSLSYKSILLNGSKTQLVINSGTQPYYKEFESLPGQEINIGDYVEWANSHWIVVTCDYDDEFYRDGQLKQCNYLLKWQNDVGEIIERWAIVQSASKYNDGTNTGDVITLGSDQLSVVVPIDEETIKLKKSMGKKFFIDNNMIDPTTYELTGTGNVPDTYNGHGVTSWILKECAYTPTEDDLKYGVCDYIEPKLIHQSIPKPNFSKSLIYKIKCTTPTIKLGGSYRTFKGIIIDNDKNPYSEIGNWVITCNFKDKLTTLLSDNQIKIKVSDKYEELVGKSFELSFCNKDNSVSDTISIQIESYM